MFSFRNLLAVTLLALGILGTAEAGIVRDKMPLQCYVDHKVTSYNKDSGQAVGWIDADVDLVQIAFIADNNVALGTHPSGNNRRVERLFWATDVFADPNYQNRNVHVGSYQQVYRTKDSGATIGSINNEDVTVVADNGNRAQIIYRLNNGNGYKMGWVPSSIVRVDGGNNGGNTNNDSRFNVNLNVPLLKQTNPVWSGQSLNQNSVTIGQRGCTITSLAMKYNYHNNANLTPVDVREKLKANGGFYRNTNSVDYGGIKRTFGYSSYIVDNKPALNNEWMKKIYDLLKSGTPVIIGAYKTNDSQHWVIVKGYTGNSTTNFSAADFQINDPSNNFTTLQQFIDKYCYGLRGIIY